jgi:chaperonin cofactor prefoldin
MAFPRHITDYAKSGLLWIAKKELEWYENYLFRSGQSITWSLEERERLLEEITPSLEDPEFAEEIGDIDFRNCRGRDLTEVEFKYLERTIRKQKEDTESAIDMLRTALRRMAGKVIQSDHVSSRKGVPDYRSEYEMPSMDELKRELKKQKI